MRSTEARSVPPVRLPRLPELVERKLYKTGQTRGASLSEIYQNRVSRSSTVLIPFSHWRECSGVEYESGSIVLVPPNVCFEDREAVEGAGLILGHNALAFYASRQAWNDFPPASAGWVAATSRLNPLGGQYVARVAGTTAQGNHPIREGFTSTQSRGAGIRVYEYASMETIRDARQQLEALMWLCRDAASVFERAGLSSSSVRARSNAVLTAAAAAGMLDLERLVEARAVNAEHATVCPLCLAPMSAQSFLNRVQQAEGREVLDTTITEASLFHIAELRVGQLGHRPYNLGWGHHHCNVVAKDAGIPATLEWMRDVMARNGG